VTQSLAVESNKQRESYETLARQSVNAYRDYLSALPGIHKKGPEAVRHSME
jgi:hypothetical protein